MFLVHILFLAIAVKADIKAAIKEPFFENNESNFGDLLSFSRSKPVFFEMTGDCGLGFCGEYTMVEDVTVKPTIELSLGKDYLPSNGRLAPYLVHQALLTFTATQDGIQYPLSGFPVDIKTVEGSQKVYYFDQRKGSIVKIIIHSQQSTRLFTNDNGQLRLSVKIKNDDTVGAQNLLFKTIDRPNIWNTVLLDLSLINKLSKLNAATVKEANPQISDEKAELVAEKVTNLFSYVKLRQTTALSKSTSEHFYDAALLKNRPMKRVFFSWETALAEFTKGLDQLNVQRSFNPIKWVKEGAIGAYQLVSKLFRLVGSTLVSVLNKLKSFVNWSAVIRTQKGFYEVFNAMASHSTALLLENKANVVETLTKSAKKQGNEQLTSVLDAFKVTPETSEYVNQMRKPHVQFGFTLDSATSSLTKAQPILDGQTELLTEKVLNLANKLPQQSELKEEKAIIATKDIINRSRRLKSMLHRSKNIVGELVHIIKSAYLVVLSLIAFSVDAALYLLGAVINLVWFVLTLPLRVWPFNTVLSTISDSSDTNAFTLLTLGPAAVYTYTHMFLNGGKEPFPMELNVVQPVADLKHRGLIRAYIESHSVLYAIGMSMAVFVKVALFLALVGLVVSAFTVVAISPFAIISLFFLFIVGCFFLHD